MRPTVLVGFETGDSFGWTITGAGLAVNGTAAITGSYGLDCNVASGVTSHLQIEYGSPPSRRYLKFNLKVPVSGFPSSRRVIYRLASTAAAAGRAELALDSSGNLSWGSNNAQTAVLTTLTAGAVYCVEVGYDDTAALFAVRVNESIVLDWTAITDQTIAIDFLGTLDTVAAAIRYYVDDLVIDFDDWPGQGYIKAVPLTLAVDNAGWTPNTGSDKTAVMTETPPDSDTTYLLGPNVSGSSTDIFWSFTLAADMVVVRGVDPKINTKRDGASSSVLQLLMRDSTNTGHLVGSVTLSATASYAWRHDVDWPALSPWGPFWSKSRLESAQFGLRSFSTNRARVTAFVIEVLYDVRNNPYEPTIPVMMSGFEPGDFSEMATHSGSQANASVTTTRPRSGARTFRSNPASGAQSRTQWTTWVDWWSASNLKEQFGSFWINVDTRQASGNVVIAWVGSGRVLMNASGGLLAFSAGDSQTSSASANDTIPLDTATHVAFQVRLADGTGANGFIKVWVNDILTINFTACNPGTSLSSVSCGLGNNVNAPSAGFDAYYDDYVSCIGIRRPRKDDRLDWLNPSDVGEGYAGTNWTATGDTTLANTIDDGTSPDDDTTYDQSPANTTDIAAIDMGNLDSAAQQVFGLLLAARVKRDGATNGILAYGVNFADAGRHEFASTTSTSAYTDGGELTWMNPRGRWTPTFINDVEVALRSNSVNRTRVTRVYMTVWYSRAIERVQPRQKYHGTVVG